MTVTIESETEVPFDFEYEQTAREVIAQAMDSEEFPYVTKPKSKYGYQFRIYLSDTDGCPSVLAH